jgi:hypothetical protein
MTPGAITEDGFMSFSIHNNFSKRGPLAAPKLFAALALLTLAALPQAVQAQTAAIDFTSSSINGATSTTSTRGYEFNITSSVTVIGLSVFDELSDGLVEAHDVGLWDSSGTLLASTVVVSFASSL